MKKIALKGFILSAIASLIFLSSTTQGESFPKLPASVDEYLETSHVIVVGRIGKAVKVHTFYGYQENAAERERLDPLTPLQLGLPVVDYEIEYDEVLMDDGHFSKNEDGSLILRVLQGHGPKEADRAYRENQGRFILFLTRNPDNATYGPWSPAHVVRIDDGTPSYIFKGERWPILTGSDTGDDFVGDVREAVQKL